MSTLVGNTKITNAAPTEKEKAHPWLYPFSGYVLGNALRNAYWYSQYQGSSLISLTFPYHTTIRGEHFQSASADNGGVILDGSLDRIIHRQRITFPPATHLYAEWSYSHLRHSAPGDLTFRLELTGTSITEVCQASGSIPEWRNDGDPRQVKANFERAHTDVQRVYRDSHLLKVSGNADLAGEDVWVNVYIKGDVNSGRAAVPEGAPVLVPLTFDLFYRNIPQGDGT